MSERRHEAGRLGRSLPLLSLPVGGCERETPDDQGRRSDGTRPGAWDGACPSPRSQLGMRAGDDGRWRRRSDGTRPGARDVAFPSSRSQLGDASGRRQMTGDDGATARGRALGTELSPPLAPSWGMLAGDARSPETTERQHEAGGSGYSFPLLSLPVRDASRRRR